jgi:hypothetical protein
MFILKEKKTTTYDVRYPCPSLGQAQKCEGVKYLLDVYSTPYIFPLNSTTVQTDIKQNNTYSHKKNQD